MHDSRCELEAQKNLLEVFGSWDVLEQLPQPGRGKILEDAGISGPTDCCHCARRAQNGSDFIRLWTAASAAANYNKDAWKDIERQLLKAKAI